MKSLNHEKVLEKIDSLVKEYSVSLTEDDEVTGDLCIRELGVDSIDLMEIIFGLEDEFDIKIEEKDLAETDTINDLIARIT